MNAIGLTGIRDTKKAEYQAALMAARSTKGSQLTKNEIQQKISLINDQADVAASKAHCISYGVDLLVVP